MSMIHFFCKNCGGQLKANADAVGKRCACPRCRSSMTVPNTTAATSFEDQKGDDLTPCPYCSEKIQRSARKCKHCGEILDRELRESRRIEPNRALSQSNNSNGNPQEKSLALAMLLELLPGLCIQTFGIGHIYAGNTGVGIGFLVGFWAIVLANIALIFFCGVGLIIWPVCWIIFMIVSPVLLNQHLQKINPRGVSQQ